MNFKDLIKKNNEKIREIEKYEENLPEEIREIANLNNDENNNLEYDEENEEKPKKTIIKIIVGVSLLIVVGFTSFFGFSYLFDKFIPKENNYIEKVEKEEVDTNVKQEEITPTERKTNKRDVEYAKMIADKLKERIYNNADFLENGNKIDSNSNNAIIGDTSNTENNSSINSSESIKGK